MEYPSNQWTLRSSVRCFEQVRVFRGPQNAEGVPISLAKWGSGVPVSLYRDMGTGVPISRGSPYRAYTGTRLHELNFTRYGACTNSLLKKGGSVCSTFKALSSDTSFIKIGQKLSTLEFNFRYRLSSPRGPKISTFWGRIEGLPCEIGAPIHHVMVGD